MVSEQELTKKIMRRVYGVYLFRQLTSPAVRTGVLLLAGIIVVSSVSISHVVSNALNIGSISGFVNFFFVAVAHTTLAVQLSGLGALLILGMVVVDMVHREGSAQLSLG